MAPSLPHSTYDDFTVMSHTQLRNLPVAVSSFLDARSRLMDRRAIISFSLVLSGVLAVTSHGRSQDQPPPADGNSLAATARAAAKDFQAVPPQDASQAKANLVQAMSQLDAFLRTGAPAKAVGWKKYLQWNDLVALSQQEQLTADVASTVLTKLRANHAGLEMAPFTRLRDALDGYVSAAGAGAVAVSPEDYSKRVEDLAAQLDAYEKDPAAGDAALAIGRAVGWLEANRQSPRLVSSVRQTYGNPNLFGYASHRLAAAGIEDYVDQVTGVRDNILGTSLHGTARLTGRTTLVFNEDPHAASMRILLGGTAVSRNVGYNGPVTIQTTGVTSIAGQKQISMTADGLIGYRATAGANTNSTIHDISARCGLIEKIAWKRAGQQKSEAEAIGSQHAAVRVANQMDNQAAGLIAEQNGRYREKFRDPLVRRGEFPELLAFSSTSDRLQVKMLQASAGLIAAPGNPPEQAVSHDAAVRAHESVVINFAQGLLGGFELTDLRLEKLIRDDLEAELPEELRVTLPDGTLDQEKDPWSIIFAKELPVRARFNEGGLSIAIRAEGFTRGEGDTPGKYRPAITELLEISAAYTIEKTPQGATLKRVEDVRVRFPNRANPDQITVRDNAIVTFIRRKFRNLFKDEFVGEGIELKGRFARAGKLRLQDIRSDQAWLSLGWQLDSTAPPAAESAE